MIREDITLGPVRLIRGDCTLIAPTLKGVDAVITDPPYGIGQDRGMGGGGYDSTGKYPRKPRSFAGGWDNKPPDQASLEVAVSIGRVAVVWGGNYMTLKPSGRWLVWNKEQVMPSYSDAELAWTNIEGSSVKMFTFGCNKARIEQGLHPTQKPVALMSWCMDIAKVQQGALILDPYMGSGTTLIAAIRTGRRAIGIEIDERHFRTAVERVKRELAQPMLPAIAPQKVEQQDLIA